MFHIIRVLLWSTLFLFSVVLLGLTSYRIHYTRRLAFGDILTSRSHFYEPIIVELLAASALCILASLWFIPAIMARVGRGPMGKYISELVTLFILFVMFLVGASIITHTWRNLRWCRSFKVCRILRTIIAFSHMLWILALLGMLFTLFNMWRRKHSVTGPVHGRETYDSGAYPETREKRTTNGTSGTVHGRDTYDNAGTYPDTRETRTTTTTTTAYNNPNVATGGHTTTTVPATGNTGLGTAATTVPNNNPYITSGNTTGTTTVV